MMALRQHSTADIELARRIGQEFGARVASQPSAFRRRLSFGPFTPARRLLKSMISEIYSDRAADFGFGLTAVGQLTNCHAWPEVASSQTRSQLPTDAMIQITANLDNVLRLINFSHDIGLGGVLVSTEPEGLNEFGMAPLFDLFNRSARRSLSERDGYRDPVTRGDLAGLAQWANTMVRAHDRVAVLPLKRVPRAQ